MTSRVFLGTVASVALCSGASLAHAQSPAAIFAQQIDSLEVWDRQIALVTQLAWGVNAMSQAAGPDRSGRSLESHWNDNILTAEVKQQLDELHGKAKAQSAAGDNEGLKRTLAEAAPIVQRQAFNSVVVMSYWMMQEGVTYNLKLLQPWLDRASPEERETVSARVSGALDTVTKGYTSALQSKELNMAGPQAEMVTATESAVKFLNEKRVSLVKEQADQPPPYEVAPLKRTEPCTVSNAPKPGSTNAGLASDFPSSEPFYPAEMKRRGVEGKVVVNVDVSTTGCAEAARLVSSSGAKQLDEAGLRYAMVGRYIPAAKGEAAVAGSLTFRIQFELKNGPQPPP